MYYVKLTETTLHAEKVGLHRLGPLVSPIGMPHILKTLLCLVAPPLVYPTETPYPVS